MAKPVAVYDFRHSMTRTTIEEIGKMVTLGLIKKLSVQLERGDTGYTHFQGRFSLCKKRRKTEVLSLLRAHELPEWEYLAPTVGDNRTTAFYVTKADTRIDGPWTEKYFLARDVYVPRQYRGKEKTLRPFQRTILDSAAVFDERYVNVVVDPAGGVGKTVLAALGELQYSGYDIPFIADYERLVATVQNILSARDERSPKIMFFDIPRAISKRYLRGVLAAIEQIKKGKVVDSRNHFREWWFDSPQIWVFTNTDLNYEMLSEDRWKLWTISKAHELVPWEPPAEPGAPSSLEELGSAGFVLE